MSEIKITKNSLENAILKDGLFISGYVGGDGYISADSEGTHAEGFTDGNNNIIASGRGAHAEGYNTLAFGLGAHAEGYNTSTSGQGAHAEGYNTAALCVATHAEGFDTKAGGIGEVFKNTSLNSSMNPLGLTYDGSKLYISDDTTPNNIQINDILKLLNNRYTISFINNTPNPYRYIQFTSNLNDADANWALNNKILKMYTEPVGNYSHAGGIGTIANQEAMTAIGKYNVSTNTENTLFVVGDGTGSADVVRSDAFRVVSGGSSTESPIPSSAQAKVNGVSDVYLGCPIGTVVMWAGGSGGSLWDASTDAPDGWLICDGRVIPTTDDTYITATEEYKDFLNLLDVIGTKYGTFNPANPSLLSNVKTVKNKNANKNGTKNVCIPNFAKHFPLGAGYSTDTQVVMAERLFDIKAGNETYLSYNGQNGGEAEHILTADEMKGHTHIEVHGTKVDVGTNLDDTLKIGNGIPYNMDSDPHNNIPPFLAINFIIKYK